MSKPIRVRHARACDAALLSRLGEATFIESFGHLYNEKDLQAFLDESHSIESYEAILGDDDWRAWIAETPQGEAAGYVVAGPCSLPARDMPANAGELTRLYVLERFQGDGLGSMLLSEALDFLTRRFDAIYLSVYSENVRAQKLYVRFGFEKTQEYFFMVGDHADPEWIMRLKR